MRLPGTVQPVTGSLGSVARYLRFAYRAIGRHLFPIWGLGLIAAALEGVGILLFVPILMRFVSESPDAPEGRLAGAVTGWAENYSIESLLAVMVMLFVAKGALVFGNGVYRASVFNRARERMRHEVFEELGQVKMRAVETRNLGSLGNLLVHEIDLAGYALDRITAALGSMTTALLLFAVAVALNPALSLVLIASGAVSLVLLRFFARARMAISRDATDRAGRMGSLAIESMQAFKYLRSTGRFDVLKGAFGVSAESARRVADRAARVDNLRIALREPLLVLWIGAVFYLFVVVLRQSVGVITDGILFFYRVSIEISLLQDHWQEFAGHAGSVDAYRQLRTELGDAAEPQDLGAPLIFENEIRLDGVSFAYGTDPVLQDLHIKIPKLQTVALVGSSGAGKSTVVDLVAACFDPTSGAVRVDGIDLRELSRSQYRSSLGYVTQESVMFSGSVARNITMQWTGEISAPSLEHAKEAARLANCLELIEGLEGQWEAEIGERGFRLSGGERQRIAIARELFAEPQLLILDEATSALDSVSERAVQESLERMHGRFTLLMVAHRLSTIRHADTIVVLEDGRAVEQGSFDDLRHQPGGRFRELCEAQSLV